MSDETKSHSSIFRRNDANQDGMLPFAGIIAFFGMVLLSMLLGGSVGIFINIPSIVLCAGGVMGLSLIAFSFDDLSHALLQIPRIILPGTIPKENIHPADPEVLRGMIVYLYASGVIGLVIGMIQLFDGFEDSSFTMIRGASVALLCPFYSLLGSEGILRPMANHLERRLKGTP